MASYPSLVVLAACAVFASSALAQDKKIEAFLSDPIEVFTEDEDVVGEYDVSDIKATAVKVLDESSDMYLLDFAGAHKPGWVFKTDVKSEAGCRVAAGAKVAKAKNASTMGLDGDLCE